MMNSAQNIVKTTLCFCHERVPTTAKVQYLYIKAQVEVPRFETCPTNQYFAFHCTNEVDKGAQPAKPRGGGARANKKLSHWGRLEEPNGDV